MHGPCIHARHAYTTRIRVGPRVYAWYTRGVRVYMGHAFIHTIAIVSNVNQFDLERMKESGKQWARYKESMALLRRMARVQFASTIAEQLREIWDC